MKRNAIFRIVLWCIVLIVLLGILTSFLLGNVTHRLFHRDAVATSLETHIPLSTNAPGITSPAAPNAAGTPSVPEATIPAAPGSTLPAVTVQVTQPEEIHSSGVGSSFSVPMNEVSEIEIEWVAGSISIQTGTGSDIQVTESGDGIQDYTMSVRQKGSELTIAYADNMRMGLTTKLSKDLTLIVPEGWGGSKLDISTASSSVEVKDLVLREFDLEGGSGQCTFSNCSIDSLDLATVSGDVSYSGTLNTLDWEAASANLVAVLANTPRGLDLESVSGNIDITLPSDSGFSLRMEGIAKNFATDFETTQSGGRLVSGNGQCKIEIEAVSSDLTIRKG